LEDYYFNSWNKVDNESTQKPVIHLFVYQYGSKLFKAVPAMSKCVYNSLLSRKLDRNAAHIVDPAYIPLFKFSISAIFDFVFSMK
jgi:hypothetical protein